MHQLRGLMASISRINNHVQVIDPASGGVFGLELLQAVEQFLLQDDVPNRSVPPVANVEHAPIVGTMGHQMVDLPNWSAPQPFPAPPLVHVSMERGKLNPLTREMVGPYFKVPLGLAANALGVSRATLMMWSRICHIQRWPYHMIKSLEHLIRIVKILRFQLKTTS